MHADAGGCPMVVTTSRRPTDTERARAAQVSVRCGAPLVPRASREVAARAHFVYVVSRDAEKIVGARILWVHPGTAQVCLSRGRLDPLLQAVAPGRDPITSVVDATLGLARDALHLAAVLRCPVLGIEASAPLACLAEGGLRRLTTDPAWSAAAALVTVRHGRSEEVLASLPPGSADVVLLDPMFSEPRRAAPGFDMMRPFALPGGPSEQLLAAAARVARRRVVLKVSYGAALPPGASALRWTGRVHGKAFEYLVCEGDALRSAPTCG